MYEWLALAWLICISNFIVNTSLHNLHKLGGNVTPTRAQLIHSFIYKGFNTENVHIFTVQKNSFNQTKSQNE